MQMPTQKLTAANFARIFVALQRALTIAPPRNARAPLLQPENVWALSVLLGERAYRSTNPPAEDYRLAIKALGPLAGENQDGPLWPVVVEAGDASDRAESIRAAEKLAAQLARFGIDLVASLATEARLASFRAAAQQISPQPTALPTLDSIFGVSPGDAAVTTVSASHPAAASRPNRVVTRALIYGLPIIGGLTLLAGAISFVRKRGVLGHG